MAAARRVRVLVVATALIWWEMFGDGALVDDLIFVGWTYLTAVAMTLFVPVGAGCRTLVAIRAVPLQIGGHPDAPWALDPITRRIVRRGAE